MSVTERDAYTGHMTTGHDWNGIKELNTPVPLLVLLCLAAAFLFSVGYWILMPAWPGVESYTRGTLHIDQRDTIKQEIAEADSRKQGWTQSMQSASFDEIRQNADLMAVVASGGSALFEDNCAMCHGQVGQGGVSFPRLNDKSWLWGDQPETILKTLQVGINAGSTGSRVAQMPAFGKTGVLDSEAIANVSLFVQSLSNPAVGGGTRATELLKVQAGQKVWQANCVACHGTGGAGNQVLGAPDLTDDAWLYGQDLQVLVETITNGRQGHMPAWQNRLRLAELKILTLYVLGLGEGPAPAVQESES